MTSDRKTVFDNFKALLPMEIFFQDSDSVFFGDRDRNLYVVMNEGPVLSEGMKSALKAQKADLLMTFGSSQAESICSLLGLEPSECVQAVFDPDQKIPDAINPDIRIEKAVSEDLPWIMKHYDLADRIELEEIIEKGLLWIARKDGEKAGFIGMHPEGSLGLLFVLEDFRHQKIASALEFYAIQKLRKHGLNVYAHIFSDNEKSLFLQKKLGFRFSEEPVYWLWKSSGDPAEKSDRK